MMEMETKRVAVLGDLGSIIGFRGMSMETFAIQTDEEARQTLAHLIKTEAYAVIYVTEQVARVSSKEIEGIRFQPLPAIVTIPQAGDFQGMGKMLIQDAVRQAVGFNILGDWDKTIDIKEEQ